jgi:hypothetical protein
MINQPGGTRRTLAITAAAPLLCLASRAAVAADVETRWNAAVTGHWEDPARWTGGAPVGTAPPGTAYAAIIEAAGAPYTVQVNPASNAKANSVTLDSPDAILRLESGELDLNRLVVRRGEILTSGINVIRNATIEYTPSAVFGGNVSLENVTFATDVTFTGGGTAFPTGLNTGGRTLTFRHVRGETHFFPFGPGTHISGGGAIVSDAEHGFESMQVVAHDGSMTIDPGVELRTGSGHIHLGPVSHGSADGVLNRGTLRAGAADGFARTAG